MVDGISWSREDSVVTVLRDGQFARWREYHRRILCIDDGWTLDFVSGAKSIAPVGFGGSQRPVEMGFTILMDRILDGPVDGLNRGFFDGGLRFGIRFDAPVEEFDFFARLESIGLLVFLVEFLDNSIEVS
jgi:hypothetical protein